MIRGLLLLALMSFPAVRAAAHDFYLVPDAFTVVGGQTLRVGFHNGDRFPESEDSPVIARLKDAQLWTAQGVVSIRNLRLDARRVVGTVDVPEDNGTSVLSARTAPNLITLAPDKFTAYLREEGLQEIIDWRGRHGESGNPGRERYSKFAKALLVVGTADASFAHRLDFPIEIIPEMNPADLRTGDRLSVLLVLHGKAAAGVQMEASWWDGKQSTTKPLGRTDLAGRIQVPIVTAGQWRLHSVIMERCAEPAIADGESLWTSVTFEVANR